MTLDKRFWRRRAAHLLLLLGAALVASQLLGAMPREQTLLFSPPPGSQVLSLQAVWSDEDGDELGGVTLHYPKGRVSPIRHRLELANGEYEIQIDVQFLSEAAGKPGARSKTNLRRRVTLRGGETPISLHQPH